MKDDRERTERQQQGTLRTSAEALYDSQDPHTFEAQQKLLDEYSSTGPPELPFELKDPKMVQEQEDLLRQIQLENRTMLRVKQQAERTDYTTRATTSSTTRPLSTRASATRATAATTAVVRTTPRISTNNCTSDNLVEMFKGSSESVLLKSSAGCRLDIANGIATLIVECCGCLQKNKVQTSAKVLYCQVCSTLTPISNSNVVSSALNYEPGREMRMEDHAAKKLADLP